jgi:hypothetical protein
VGGPKSIAAQNTLYALGAGIVDEDILKKLRFGGCHLCQEESGQKRFIAFFKERKLGKDGD